MPNYVRYIIIVVLASLLFLPFLGHVHLFDWDEINFAECAREMISSKDYLRIQIDFRPFWEKPPLFIWMQVLAMKLFGINEYAARFPNAFIGIVTLTSIFYVGKRVINEKMATWWVLLYAASWLPHFYFKSGIIDPTFNYFIFLAFFQVHLLRYAEKKILHAVLGGIFLGLAVLTKGPVAILVAVLSFIVYIIVNKGLWGHKIKYLLLFALCAILTTALWFGIEIINHGFWFVNEFITYQIRLFKTEDADHGGPFYYHFIILLIGCFPASIFLFQYARKRITDNEPARDFTKWMWILFWTVLILFSIVKTKIVHYSSLCYFPLTYLAALQLYRLCDREIKIKKGVKALLLVIGSLVAIAITALPLVGIYKEKLIPYINDPFAVGNLQANVPWSYSECLWGIVYLIGIWVAVLLMKKSFRRGMIILCVLQILIIEVTVIHFTPKIEAYSQRAAIEYFQSFQGKNVYVHVLGYKSYAQLFYTQKQPSTNPNYYNEQWLLTGKVDKPTYFICKIMNADKYKAMPQLQEIGEKNGFAFFKRR
ncbi:MAG TPA: glycosyltransferase family 39 protein [Flavipsychrobacter sp.]|nr:glycosyltransferase family 39 protein [Flavipsychrobacter sp.]